MATSYPKSIGMSANAGDWSTRLKEVGSGVHLRRIYADLANGGDDQKNLIDQAFKANMVPLVSYKVGGDYAGAKSGKFDSAAKAAAKMISAYNKPALVCVLHEPQGDLSGSDYVAISKRLDPLLRVGQIKVGPVLNGWLLDKQVKTFASFTDADLLKKWDFLAIDTYESGTQDAPGTHKPADRIPLLVKFAADHGYTGPLGVAEWNGFSAQTIKACGDAILSTPQFRFGLLWNSTGGKGFVLSGDKLTAFQQVLKDSRNQAMSTF